MKTVKTNYTEEQFLNRLETLCIKKSRFLREKADKNCFLVSGKNGRFRIVRHTRVTGSGDGNSVEVALGTYRIAGDGRVEVSYRIGRQLEKLMPFVLLFILGGIALIWILIAGIVGGDVKPVNLLLPAAVMLLSALAVFLPFPKDRKLLENKMKEIVGE